MGIHRWARNISVILLFAFLAPFLASCGAETPEKADSTDSFLVKKANTVQISQVWARQTLVPGQPTGVYLTIENATNKDVRLLQVSVNGAERAEMHDSVHTDGIVRMVQLDDLVVAAGSIEQFQPGGKHIMVFGLPQLLKPGMQVLVTLTFENASPMDVQAIVSANMNAPDNRGHHGH